MGAAAPTTPTLTTSLGGTEPAGTFLHAVIIEVIYGFCLQASTPDARAFQNEPLNSHIQDARIRFNYTKVLDVFRNTFSG